MMTNRSEDRLLDMYSKPEYLGTLEDYPERPTHTTQSCVLLYQIRVRPPPGRFRGGLQIVHLSRSGRSGIPAAVMAADPRAGSITGSPTGAPAAARGA